MGGSESKTKEVAESKDPVADWIGGLVPVQRLVSDADAWARNLVALSPARQRVAIALVALFSAPKEDAGGHPVQITDSRLRQLAHWVGDECYGNAAATAATYASKCFLRTRFLQVMWQFRSFQPFQEFKNGEPLGDRGEWEDFGYVMIMLRQPDPKDHAGSWDLVVYFDGVYGPRFVNATLLDSGSIVVSKPDEMRSESRRQLAKIQAAVLAAFADEKDIVRLEAKEEADWSRRSSRRSELNGRLSQVSKQKGPVDSSCGAGRVRVRGALGSSDVTMPKCETEGWMISGPIPQWALAAAEGEPLSSSNWSEPHDAETAQDISSGDVNVALGLIQRRERVSADDPTWHRRRHAKKIMWLVRWLGASSGPSYRARLADLRARWPDPAFEPFYTLGPTTANKPREARDILSATYPGTYLLDYTGNDSPATFAQVKP